MTLIFSLAGSLIFIGLIALIAGRFARKEDINKLPEDDGWNQDN
jgi:hypothetical protein